MPSTYKPKQTNPISQRQITVIMPITTWTRLTAASPSASLLDPETTAGKAFLATIEDALNQEACHKVHYGREVEDEANYWVFAEWESVEARLAYVQSE